MLPQLTVGMAKAAGDLAKKKTFRSIFQLWQPRKKNALLYCGSWSLRLPHMTNVLVENTVLHGFLARIFWQRQGT